MPYDNIIAIPKGWRTPRVVELADGWGGTKITVDEARALVDASLNDALVVATAQNLVRNLPERDQWAEAQAIDGFVKGKIRYTNEGKETIKSPGALLREIKQYGKAIGDCDDHVILWAALHRALGHPVRWRVISQRPDGLANHIYGEVYIKGRGWVSDELIVKNRPLGWHIPKNEVTNSVAYMAGLGGVTRGERMPNAMAIFKPGGAKAMHERRLKPRRRYMAVDPFVAQGYKIKRGGALTQGPGGNVQAIAGQLGQFDTLLNLAVSAAPNITKAVKAAKGKKAAPMPSVKPQGGGFDIMGTLKNPVVLGGLGISGLLIVWKLTKK